MRAAQLFSPPLTRRGAPMGRGEEEAGMRDLGLVALVIVFFALSVAIALLCAWPR